MKCSKPKSSKHSGRNCIGRREFMRLSSVAASGVVLSPLLKGCDQPGEEEEPSGQGCDQSGPSNTNCRNLRVLNRYTPDVASIWVPRGEQSAYYNQFKAMIEGITDFAWLRPNDKILIKLALNSGKSFPATTDPWLLDVTLKLLEEKGATNILVGDQSGAEHVLHTATISRGSSRSLCQNAGLLNVINHHNATPVFFEERIAEIGYEKAYIPVNPSGTHHWPVPPYVTSYLEEVDHIIYLPRVSSHIIADATLGMKIAVGFLNAESRKEFHQGGADFYAMYEEINQIPQIRQKLRFTATSGRAVLRTSGPDSGDVVQPDYGLVFASQDLLAHDILSYAWLKDQNHSRGDMAPSMINRGLMMAFSEVNSSKDAAGQIPTVSGLVTCHPAMLNFMLRKGGRPARIAWNDLNPDMNPDGSAAIASAIQFS